MVGWYFSTADRVLGRGDSRQIVVGKTHTVSCRPVLCKSGLHASERLIDALKYAPGPILYRVWLGGVIVMGEDKACATERKYLYGGYDVSDILREFARQCALDVVHLWDAPAVVVKYLNTGDSAIRAAGRD